MTSSARMITFDPFFLLLIFSWHSSLVTQCYYDVLDLCCDNNDNDFNLHSLWHAYISAQYVHTYIIHLKLQSFDPL